MGFGQFDRYILSLQEQANTVRPQEILCIAQQLRQGRAGPRRHQIEGLRWRVFHPLIADLDGNLHPLGGGLQKGTLLGRGLEKSDRQPVAQKRRQDQARKACAAAHVSQGLSVIWNKGGKLGRIPDMASPDIGQGRSGNQIVTGIPIGQQINLGLEPGQCFT